MADGTMTPADMAAVMGNDGLNGNMGFFWVFALMILAGGGFNWGNNRWNDGPGNYVTQADLTNQLNNQTLQNSVNNLATDNANMRYDFATLIGNQTMQMYQQNANNQVELLTAYNQIANAIAALGYQMNTCCCDIKTQMLQDKYEALQEKYLSAQIDISNYNQTQTILNTQGRWVGWTPSGSQAAAGT